MTLFYNPFFKRFVVNKSTLGPKSTIERFLLVLSFSSRILKKSRIFDDIVSFDWIVTPKENFLELEQRVGRVCCSLKTNKNY